jgi:hypothetical protein
VNIKPRNDDLDDWLDVYGGSIAHGHIDAIAYDLDDLSDEEYQACRAEREQARARKRPLGFAPWPDAIPDSDA